MNHMIELGSKVFACFLDFRKAFDTVWIDDLLFKLFYEFEIRGRMCLAKLVHCHESPSALLWFTI